MNIPDEEMTKIKDMIARYLHKNKFKKFDEPVKKQESAKLTLKNG